MRIRDYLVEMEHAIRHVLAEVHREHAEAERLRAELKRLNRATSEGYRRAEWFALNPDLDDEGLGTLAQTDTYFGPDRERFYKEEELTDAESRVAAHEFSTAALAGTLLQFAKQGISLRYGRSWKTAPVGRLVASLPLHEVIWQARNQALHWEEGTFKPATEQCFQRLVQSEPKLGMYKTRNMAFEIVMLLNWSSFEAVRDDLLLLDP